MNRIRTIEGIRLGQSLQEFLDQSEGGEWSQEPADDFAVEFVSTRWTRQAPLTSIDVDDDRIYAASFWERCRVGRVDLIGVDFATLQQVIGERWVVDTVDPLVLEFEDWCEVRIDNGRVRRVTFADYESQRIG